MLKFIKGTTNNQAYFVVGNCICELDLLIDNLNEK